MVLIVGHASVTVSHNSCLKACGATFCQVKLLKEGKDIPAELAERIQSSKAKAEVAPPEPSAQTPPTSGATANQTELLKAKVLSCRLNFGVLASVGLSTQPDLNSYMELKWLHPLTEYVLYLCWIRTVQVAFPVELTPALPQPVKCLGRMMPANSTFSTPITSIFNAMCFDENSFTCQCKKEDRNS